MARSILIIDDEAAIRSSLSGVLVDEGYDVVSASSGEEGIGLVSNQQFDAILLDVWMPGIDGIETLKRVRSIYPDQIVIVMSGHGNVETAVKATKYGAFDFVEKPLSLEKVLVVLRNGIQLQELNKENRILRSEVFKAPVMIGSGKAMMDLREKMAAVSPLNSWVLITGENGTGKELVARSIHASSKRKDNAFIAVNCAAIPEELIESELFGHEKGAFTGATNMKRGKFDLANGGTLFLDEIADMSLKTQAKILRILQEQRFERLGGDKTIEVDVRVIAATNKNLIEEIKQGNFREDLYYRLAVIPLVVPPLRNRKEDIPTILRYYFEQFGKEQGREPKKISEEALRFLVQYSWPGNVRELRNMVERLGILGKGEQIVADDLPLEVLEATAKGVGDDDSTGEIVIGQGAPSDLREAKQVFEREFILKKLKENDWNVSKTAQVLGIERAHLHRKIKAFKIDESVESEK